MKVTILGCGSSAGVPRIGGMWGACDPNEPRNQRTRCSILVQEADTTLLIDTAPDLREQLLRADVGAVDAVLYTHDHADQTAGIDDLRAVALNMRRKVDVYGDAETLDALTQRFGYIFVPQAGTGYPAIATAHAISGPFRIGAIDILPIAQRHGPVDSLGFRFGAIAYSNDVSELSDAAFEALAGVDTWIVDALRYTPHPTHAHLERTLEWIARLRPRRAVLTNMHIDLDYRTLLEQLPDGVEPAYDGMVLKVTPGAG